MYLKFPQTIKTERLHWFDHKYSHTWPFLLSTVPKIKTTFCVYATVQHTVLYVWVNVAGFVWRVLYDLVHGLDLWNLQSVFVFECELKLKGGWRDTEGVCRPSVTLLITPIHKKLSDLPHTLFLSIHVCVCLHAYIYIHSLYVCVRKDQHQQMWF